MFLIGSWQINNPVLLAPMAGVSDLPFRRLCREFGAGLTCGEMVTSDERLWRSRKSSQRLKIDLEQAPRAIQIVGTEPELMASAAHSAERLGADIIDINMGCPAKKVCNKAAGSALLRDEKLVADILRSVKAAVSKPVTLKIRTGWDPQNRNAVRIAQIAESEGIAALAVHGRTRACRFKGQAEYDTIASVVRHVQIPVIANGDIREPEEAAHVLNQTGAAGVMIGRGAQGRPWIFREISHYLNTGERLEHLAATEAHPIIRRHVIALHEFYGDHLGVRIARKHVNWYLETLGRNTWARQLFNSLTCPEKQLETIDHLFTENIIREVAAV